jgi:hypothetical protein
VVGRQLARSLSQRRRTALGVAAAAFFFSAQGVAAQNVTPFFSFNQSPIIQLHGLPAIDNAGILRAGQARYRLVHDLASDYTFHTSATENLLFDGETNRTTLVYARGIGTGWEWGLQIPYVRHDGGWLDGFIEDWHDTFGLPQGGRDTAPHNQFSFLYQRQGVTQLALSEAVSGIGDVRLSAGWQWPGGDKAQRLAVRAALSLPTGDSRQLRGSGGTDFALWLVADRAYRWWDWPATVFGGGGVLLLGDGEVLADQQRPAALFGSIGAGARVLPWVSLKLQADFHGPLYQRSELKEVNATAMQFLMGGDLQLGKKVQLDLMVGEDIIVHASPDVVFHIGLSLTD